MNSGSQNSAIGDIAMERTQMKSSLASSGAVEINAPRMLVVGSVLWLLGTIGLRIFGQYIFHPDNPIAIVALLLISFPPMFLLVRKICADAKIPVEQWPLAAIVLLTPTFVMDTLSSSMFSIFYPNIDQRAAGLYGGWIIWCIGAALLGVIVKRR
jgi:hypothetical protein